MEKRVERKRWTFIEKVTVSGPWDGIAREKRFLPDPIPFVRVQPDRCHRITVERLGKSLVLLSELFPNPPGESIRQGRWRCFTG